MFFRKHRVGQSGEAVHAAFGSTALNTAQAQEDHSMSNPGPQNSGLVRLNPNSNRPPPTDQGSVGSIWHSFDLTHRRVQEGGWTHQVTQREIPLSTEIAGVNMRIDSGAFRELHWHTADEWAYMLTGSARVTLFGADGSMFIDDIQAGDLWNFPAGLPHSIQGLGDQGCEFLLVFNEGSFSEESTFLLSDWLKHTPPELLQKNFGLGPASISKLPKEDPLYIFASDLPTNSLVEDIAEVAKHAGLPKLAYSFKASSMKPTRTNQFGEVRIVDSRNFPASSKISAGIVTLKPGGLRELHWHPTVSEWQYWIQGTGRMTVFGAQQNARTMDFHANDVGFVPAMAGHCIENIGEEDLVFLELFAFPDFEEISLNNWLRSMPVQVAAAHTNLSPEEIAGIPPKANKLVG
jgi:oxalate decarboxylase